MTGIEIITVLVIVFIASLFVFAWWYSYKVMREQWTARNKIRKSDEYKDKGYFRFYWGEQKRLFKKAFSPEYKTEAILGVGLGLIYVFYILYAVFAYPELRESEGISDPSHPIFSEFGYLAILTGAFSLIRAYFSIKRGRIIDQLIEADVESAPVTYKSSVFGSIFGGIMFILIGIMFVM